MTDTGKRTRRYQRKPCAYLFFSDANSHAFWHPLDDQATSYVQHCSELLKSNSGEFSDNWLPEAFFEAIDLSLEEEIYDLVSSDSTIDLEQCIEIAIATLRTELAYSGEKLSYFGILHGMHERSARC